MQYVKLVPAVIFAAIVSSVSYAEIVIVANKSAPVIKLSVEQVKLIFLQKTNTFPDGTPVVAVDLPNNNSIRDEFYKKAIKKDPGQVKSYWAKRVFTGKGTPNDTKSNESGVKRWVNSGKNNIGYISANSVDDSVRVLLRLP